MLSARREWASSVRWLSGNSTRAGSVCRSATTAPNRRALQAGHGESDCLATFLLRHGGLALFATPELVTGNGWQSAQALSLSERDAMSYTIVGAIRTLDRSRFGPEQ